MSESIEKLFQQFAEGALGPEAQAEFDRRFEADPRFSEKAVRALGERLGPPPEEFLSRVIRTARPGLEEMFKSRAPQAPVASSAAPSWVSSLWTAHGPLLVLAGAALLLSGIAAMVVRERSLSASTPTPPAQTEPAAALEDSAERYTGLESDDTTRLTVVPKSSKASGKTGSGVRVGTVLRLQGLPSDASVVIDILDARGVAVRRLYQGAWSGGQSLDWDGLDAAGQPVAPGPYRARVKTSSKTYVSEFSVQ
jgi:hypothetical protein